MDIIFLLVIAVIIGLALWIAGIYNGLITFKNRVDEAWSDINVQLKRRYDLIPNLVETVKGYAIHEKTLFEKVTEARAKAISAGTVAEKGQAENMLTGALKSVFAVAENYPELKASQNFLELQRELTDTEDKIQASRRFYNGNARDFNIRIEIFPDAIIAKQLGFAKREFFEIEQKEKEPVQVKF